MCPNRHSCLLNTTKVVRRVSDRSGKPGAGNPARTCNEERDPRLCEGHAQSHSIPLTLFLFTNRPYPFGIFTAPLSTATWPRRITVFTFAVSSMPS